MRVVCRTIRWTIEPKILVFLVVLALYSVDLRAQESLPAYRAERQASGTIRIWGYGSRKEGLASPVWAAWEEGFRKHHSGIHFDTQLYGNASAIGGLYTGAADIAFMTREIEPTEVDGYQQALGHKPFQISVLTGSLDLRDYDPAVVIFVHKDNPISRLSLVQLDAIFGADHRRGPKNVRLWGELGLTNDWADKAIHLYGYDISSDAAQFFEQAVMARSEKWNCSLQEFSNLRTPDGGIVEADRQILEALAKDRYGIAIATLSRKNPLTKPLAIAVEEGGPYYDATNETVRKRKYPLTRAVSMFIDRVSDQPLNSNLKEFVSYILSSEGQAVARSFGGYLPLTPQLALQERRKLE